ncbi:hypothetical protein OIU74_028489 [Salix koriyanagi]|uniref:Uncharacterized protein n=1 Tax=Salix koriyanagi TaxID=2511006 RepID=A0A9Q0VBS8_9ROSI|nr:hypothetical protein OIU74_028489 [Salix koriyanagi]
MVLFLINSESFMKKICYIIKDKITNSTRDFFHVNTYIIIKLGHIGKCMCCFIEVSANMVIMNPKKFLANERIFFTNNSK